MTKVEAGTLSNLFSQVFNSFLRSMESIFQYEGSPKVSDQKGKIVVTDEFTPKDIPVDEDGKELPKDSALLEMVITIQWPEDDPLTRDEAKDLATDKETWTKIIWEKSENIRLDIAFKGKGRDTYNDLSKEQLDNAIQKYLEKYELKGKVTGCKRSVIFLFKEVKESQKSTDQDSNNRDADTGMDNGPDGSGQNGNANAATRMNVTLKKVVGARETSIQLIKINANYDLTTAMSDIDAIVLDDDFIDQMPENEEINYEITSDESDYDINECDDFNCCDSIDQLIYDTLRVSTKLRLLGMVGLHDGNSCRVLDNGGLSYTFDAILSVLGNYLFDIGCEQVPGIEFNLDGACFNDIAAIESEAAEILECYVNSISILYDSISPGSQYKLNQHISYLEDFLRGLKQK